MANIYLIPDKDSTYISCISDDAPSTDAIFLTKEGDYPVEAWHERHDLNSDRLLMKETINNRDELIQYLDFLGQCRHAMLQLWGYDIDKNTSEDSLALFDACYSRKMELIQEDIEWAYPPDLENSDCDNFVFKRIDDSDEELPFF